MYQYSVYGLNIDSELELPELILRAVEVRADVKIMRREVPESLGEGCFVHPLWEARRGIFLLRIHNIARFLVVGGSEIFVHSAPFVDDRDVRAFLLNSALAALIQQRGLLTLHASSVRDSTSAVAFLGRSGAGKSTLYSAFSLRGHCSMADDITVTSLDGSVPIVQPGSPYSKLFGDALRQLQQSSDGLDCIRPGVSKYLLPLKTFSVKPAPLKVVYLISVQNQSEPRLENCSQEEAFRWLDRYTYRRRYLHPLGVRDKHFASLSAVARGVVFRRLYRPVDLGALDRLCDLIDNDWQRVCRSG